MSAVAIKPPSPFKPRDVGIRRRRWTRDEYYRAAEVGIFRPDERLELLDGEIIQKVSPQKPPHATSVLLGARALTTAFGPGHLVRQQLPLILTTTSEPEPDLLVVPGTPIDYLSSHPKPADLRLLVEISDTTLRLDRTRKLSAYARAGIPDYWLLNLPERRLEVYRDPSGSRYRSVTIYREEEVVALLAAPDAAIRVADLLPPLPSQEPS
jgi:Uma2 family endonuclease